MKKIGVFGTHGTGKTTLCCSLAAYYKSNGINVKIVQEMARSCPFPINLSMTTDAGLWIYHAHIKKELEARVQGFQLCLCDRTALDSFVYLKAQQASNAYTKTIEEGAMLWLNTYDMLIYVTVSNAVSIYDDGTRSADADFQMRVQDSFDSYIDQFPAEVNAKMKRVYANDIFGEFSFPPAVQEIDSMLSASVMA